MREARACDYLNLFLFESVSKEMLSRIYIKMSPSNLNLKSWISKLSRKSNKFNIFIVVRINIVFLDAILLYIACLYLFTPSSTSLLNKI